MGLSMGGADADVMGWRWMGGADTCYGSQDVRIDA